MVTGRQSAIDEDRRLHPASEEPADSPHVPERQPEAVDAIPTELLQQLLTLSENEVICPLRMKREDVSKVKAVKLSDQEIVRVSKFQAYLYDRGFLQDNTFASLFVYLFDLAFTIHRQVAEEEARKEGQG